VEGGWEGVVRTLLESGADVGVTEGSGRRRYSNKHKEAILMLMLVTSQ
jgi:hypothetical protein